MNYDNKTEQKDFRIKFMEEELLTDFSFVKVPDDLYFPVMKEGSITGQLAAENISAGDFRFEKVVGKNSWDLIESISDDGDEADNLLDEFYETQSGFGHKLGGYSANSEMLKLKNILSLGMVISYGD